MSGWVKVEKRDGVMGWCPVSGVGLNVSLADYAIVPAPATPAPTRASAPATQPATLLDRPNAARLLSAMVLPGLGYVLGLVVLMDLPHRLSKRRKER